MITAIDKSAAGRNPVICDRAGRDVPFDPPGSFDYIAVCPVCGKRVFDVADPSGASVCVRIKCPRCRKVSNIVIAELLPQT
jgi:phage FluMu protein Com